MLTLFVFSLKLIHQDIFHSNQTSSPLLIYRLTGKANLEHKTVTTIACHQSPL